MTTLVIEQEQQDTFKRYDDFIKSTANGRRLAESCGQDMMDMTQGTRSKLLSKTIVSSPYSTFSLTSSVYA
jgi:hypothetical protein